MYQAIGIGKILKIYGALIAVLAIGLATDLWGYLPILSRVPMNDISVAILAGTAITAVVGSSPLFPFICRWVPGFWRLFPNIDGVYEVEIRSNWQNGEKIDEPSGTTGSVTEKRNLDLQATSGKIVIKARLFSVGVKFSARGGYSASNAIACAISGSDDGEPTLQYIYRSRANIPIASDSSSHLGAARLSIPNEKIFGELEGNYWTDRNWQRGANTAGFIKLKRVLHPHMESG